LEAQIEHLQRQLEAATVIGAEVEQLRQALLMEQVRREAAERIAAANLARAEAVEMSLRMLEAGPSAQPATTPAVEAPRRWWSRR